jgi:hypothetical protein
MVQELNNGTKEANLSFIAYAIQKAGFDTAAAAWAQAKTL